jgi:hypothetical protein
MGFEEAPGGGGGGGGIRALMRRKQVDSDRARAAGGQQLAKELSVTQLIAIGASLIQLSALRLLVIITDWITFQKQELCPAFWLGEFFCSWLKTQASAAENFRSLNS